MRIIGGAWGGRRLQSPPGRQTRPTTDRVREAWMSAVAAELEDALVLDLFAGSGALGLEALSRGARHATFVESSLRAVAALRANLDALGVPADRATVVQGDVFRHLARVERRAFDIAFADPPYRQGIAPDLARLFRTACFASILCLEHAPDETLEGEPIWQRRYGDTQLTFLGCDDD